MTHFSNVLAAGQLLLNVDLFEPIQAAHAFRSSSTPLQRNHVTLLIKIRKINLSNRTLYRAQSSQAFDSFQINLVI